MRFSFATGTDPDRQLVGPGITIESRSDSTHVSRDGVSSNRLSVLETVSPLQRTVEIPPDDAIRINTSASICCTEPPRQYLHACPSYASRATIWIRQCSESHRYCCQLKHFTETHLEAEVTLLSLAPAVFPVKVEVSTLLVVLCDCLRIVRPLEPCQVLLVESPRLLFQFLSGAPSVVRIWAKA